MPVSKIRPLFSIDIERLTELKKIVPEAFVDGKVNWDLLKQGLGEHIEDEGEQVEHFGLFWPGKKSARKLTGMPSKGTLYPCPEDSKSWDETKNIFIEGDNLEVLKLL